ncbi:MAG: glycolate oxidase subunit GlcE, partial [Burkholderiaceae bacterium]|nr:glycolate oxidase subunit GlcE [Burkholderiaceae bacterium]
FPIGVTVLTEWGGGLRWVQSADRPEDIRAAAMGLGGHATLYRSACDQLRGEGVFTPVSPVLGGIHQRLKAELDPTGLWNPGRLMPGL